MKKLCVLLLTAAMVLSMTACGGKPQESSQNQSGTDRRKQHRTGNGAYAGSAGRKRTEGRYRSQLLGAVERK